MTVAALLPIVPGEVFQFRRFAEQIHLAGSGLVDVTEVSSTEISFVYRSSGASNQLPVAEFVARYCRPPGDSSDPSRVLMSGGGTATRCERNDDVETGPCGTGPDSVVGSPTAGSPS